MKKTLLICLTAALTLTSITTVAVSEEILLKVPGDTIHLAALVDQGVRENSALAGSIERSTALQNDIQAAGALADPKLGVALVNLPVDSFKTDQEAMTQKQVFISQKIPWFGKRGLKTQIKQQEALQAEAKTEALRSELTSQIRSLYFQIAFYKTSLKLNHEIESNLKILQNTLEEAYRNGRGSRENILLNQIRHARLLEERIQLEEKLESAQNTLRQWVDFPASTVFVLPESLSPETTEVYFETIKTRIAEQNAGLTHKKAGIVKSEAQVSFSQKAYYPDMDLKLTFGQREDAPDGMQRSDFLSLGVSFSLPMWQSRKQDSTLKAMEHRLNAGQEELTDYSRTLMLKAETLINKIHSVRRLYQLTEQSTEIQLEELKASTGKGYESGETSFAPIVNVRIKILENRLRQKKYLTDYYKLHSSLLKLASL